ncbi:MAG: hypothetical protein PHQ74_01025 [Crocinitomicaceae bacterium]|nr:hypothetical protein [Crocinitomicaceae bacterium]
MSNFTSLENMITEIQSLINKMNTGNLQLEELETLNDLTRELNERIVILKYKSYEEKVFGVSSKVEEKSISDQEIQNVISDMSNFLTNDTSEMLVEEESLDSILERKVAVDESEATTEVGVETEAEIDAEAETDAEAPIFGFDLFESNTPASFAPEVHYEKETYTQSTPEPIASIQPEVKEVIAPAEAVKVVEEAVSEPNFISNVVEEPEVIIPDAVEEPAVVIPDAVDEFVHSEEISTRSETDVFRSFQGLDSGSRLMSPKIQSLVGAFGLNEKLQCIRELYNGSSEEFNQAIEKVDHQTSFEEAKHVLAKNAIANSWDLDSNLVNEFLQKVERRFL